MASLGKDLETIRKKLNLSLEDIYDATRIPIHIIKSIEEESQFKEVETNKTYFRSFVRSYAKALKIEDDDIILALNQVDENSYSGLLSKKYLPQAGRQEKPKTSTSSPKKEETGSSPKDTTGEKDTSEKKKEPSGKQALTSKTSTPSTESKETKSSKKKPEPPKPKKDRKDKPLTAEKDKITSGEVTPYSQPDPKRNHNQTTPPPPTVSSINWAAIGKKFYSFNVKSRVWIISVFVVLAAAVIAFFFLYEPLKETQTTEVLDTTAIMNQQSVMADSLKEAVTNASAGDTTTSAVPTEDTEEPEPATVEPMQEQEQESILPYTLNVVIYAAYYKLEPVRVLSDMNNRLSPYWIEHEEGMRFKFTDRIKIRGQYRRMELLLNGHLIPNAFPRFYDEDERMLVLERSDFDGQEKWLETPPDTLANDIPQPTVVKDRPTFY